MGPASQMRPGSRPRRWRTPAVTLVIVTVVAALVVVFLARRAHRSPAAAYQPPSGRLPRVAHDSLVPPGGVLLGAWVKPTAGFTDRGQETGIVSFEHAIGRKLAIDSLYLAWRDPMPVALARWDLRSGRIPMISWAGASSAQIAAGADDPWIRTQAAALKSLRAPVLLRYFPEMNNGSEARTAGAPAEFIAAWRHLHGIFVNAGATNVHWVWTPSSTGFGTGAAQRFYPGNTYVNWIGADGYNWAPQLQGAAWRSFSGIFSAFYRWAEYAGKPLLVGEFGVTEGTPGAKATWFGQASAQLRTQFPRIRAVIYFNSVHANFGIEFDWKVTTSRSALIAFRAFARNPYLSAQPSI